MLSIARQQKTANYQSVTAYMDSTVLRPLARSLTCPRKRKTKRTLATLGCKVTASRMSVT
jgi:hypothetical protein